MCTLSWVTGDTGYQLFFNRDEKRTRTRAEAPCQRHAKGSGVQMLAPRDPEGGGTWISVNQHGLCACLLNNYDIPERAQARRSRGLIIAELGGLARLRELRQALDTMDLSDYNGFRLCALDARGAALCGDWDGAQLRWSDPGLRCISSSSVDGAQVVRQRIAMYRERFADGASAEQLLDWHSSHEPHRGASVCMHRQDGRTQSLTAVRVGAQSVAMGYSDGPPCEAALQWGPSLARLAA